MSSRKLEERIGSFVSEGLTKEEIAKRLGISYDGLISYLKNHPELPKLRDNKKGPRDLRKYTLIKSLLEQEKSPSDIAREFGVSRQAMSQYLHYHNLISNERTRKGIENRKKKIKELLSQRYTRKEIANELGISYHRLTEYLIHHKELPKPKSEREGPRDLGKYTLIKSLIESGLNQTQVGIKLETAQTNISKYINRYLELRRIYLDRRIKK